MSSFGEQTILVLKRWRLFAIAGVLGLVIGIAQVVFTDRMYRAEVSLAPIEQSSPLMSQLGSSLGLSGLAGIVPGLAGGDRDTEQMLALFGSREFALKFIEQYQLAAEMFPERWDSTNKKWKASLGLQSGSSATSAPNRRELLERFSKLRTIAFDKPTGVVRVRLEWSDSARAAELLAHMVADFNDFSRARAKQEAESAIEYLKQELAKTDVTELRQALSRVMQQQMTRSMMATVQPEFALRTIDRSAAFDKPVRPRYLVTPVLWIFASFVLALGWTALRGRAPQLP